MFLEAAVAVSALASTAALAVGALGLWKQRQWFAAVRHDGARAIAQTREIRSWLHLVDQRANSRYLPLSAYSIGADALVDVLNVIQRTNATHVVEFGAGLSSVEIGTALKRRGEGRLVSVEHDGAWVAVVRERIEEAGLSDVVSVVHAPLAPLELEGESFTWYDVRAVTAAVGDRPIDLMLVDGPPRRTCRLARYPALPLLLGRLSPSATVLLDDAERPEEREVLARWRRSPGFQERVIEGVHCLAEWTRLP